MGNYKRSLVSIDGFFRAIEGYEHVDSELLLDWLHEHFALDLDLVPEFRIALADLQTLMAAEDLAA
ncbi:hypothetical protein GCM10011316_21280 [Roseibium aquae]|uniref:Uncharacterized protein n=1 Tax=Roseibium aquae TaxID=1323746 RepID=A0A916X2C7_9HYPH|nr:hypothetical protein [Roseibium aquae]GGB48904.1 hypothetical protein GCM10011316_21280 [Roseibium aquae]